MMAFFADPLAVCVDDRSNSVVLAGSAAISPLPESEVNVASVAPCEQVRLALSNRSGTNEERLGRFAEWAPDHHFYTRFSAEYHPADDAYLGRSLKTYGCLMVEDRAALQRLSNGMAVERAIAQAKESLNRMGMAQLEAAVVDHFRQLGPAGDLKVGRRKQRGWGISENLAFTEGGSWLRPNRYSSWGHDSGPIYSVSSWTVVEMSPEVLRESLGLHSGCSYAREEWWNPWGLRVGES